MNERVEPVSQGLTLVISDKADVERDAVAESWIRAGGDVLRLGRFWDPPALDPSRTRVYGADSFCQVLAQKLGLALLSPPDDLLLHLPATVTKRTLSRTLASDVQSLAYPVFVKSMVPKLIRSRVYESADALVVECRGLEPEAELIVSEIVTLSVEARAWVLDGEVVSIACYEGEDSTVDAAELARAVATSPLVPAACVIDVASTTDRGWIALEANAAWGAGLNGCDPSAAVRCIARSTSVAAP
jgi:hypothetical protein